MAPPRLALARVNYSQLYTMYDDGKTYRQRDILTPYHLLSIAGYVRARGVEVEIFDGEVDLLSQEELAKAIIDWKPQFVGLTTTTPDIIQTLEVCGLIKEAMPSAVTIVGGSHATVLPHEVSKEKSVDYVVAGDGEEALVQIIEKERGRTSRTVGKAQSSPADKVVTGSRIDLKTQPMPAHDLLNYTNYQFTDPTRGQYRTATVMSTRGCPFGCNFCFHTRHVQYRTVDSFVDEIAFLYREKGVRYFFVYDDTFLLKRHRVMEIIRKIKALRLHDADFQCQTRGNLVTPEVIAALRDANFVRISMGVESGSAEILRRIKKGVTKEDFVSACKVLTDHGIEARASFIIGHPYETHQTVAETISFAKELDLLEANFTIMTPYPGTVVYDMALRGEGIHFVRPEYARDWRVYRRWGDPIIETQGLSADELKQAREEAVTEFYVQPKVFNYFYSLFERGNRSRYFYRPLNFAWQRKFGTNIPFWSNLSEVEVVNPQAQ